MEKIDIVIEKACDEIIKQFEDNSNNEYKLDLIEALAKLISARAL